MPDKYCILDLNLIKIATTLPAVPKFPNIDVLILVVSFIKD